MAYEVWKREEPPKILTPKCFRTDVAAEIHALEMDAVNGFVGAVKCLFRSWSDSRNAQDAPAVSDQVLSAPFRSCMKNDNARDFLRFLDAGYRQAFLVFTRISSRSYNDAHRITGIPLKFKRMQISVYARVQQIKQIGLHKAHIHFRFGASESRIELQYFRAF